MFDDLAARLDTWQQALPNRVRENLEYLVSGAKPCYTLGRNMHSKFIARHVPLSGFLDDFAEPGTTWCELPVLPGTALPPDALIINAVLHRRPHQALARLRTLTDSSHIVHYGDFCRLDKQHYPQLPFIAEARSIFFGHLEAFNRLYLRLADEESRRVFHDILLYRMTGDPAFTAGYSLRDEEQYFDVPLHLAPHPVFIDGGAYQGETTESFCRHFADYGEIHLFEPQSDSLQKSRERLGTFARIHFHPWALGDRHECVSFDATSANASRITEHGSNTVEVVALDEVLNSRADFIKFDLEGYESKALAGAARIIREQRPTLAICVYHDVADFIHVPQAVWNARDDYQIRLRHYTEGWEETVMYFTHD